MPRLKGMCCMNLSDHSESTHKSIQVLNDRIKVLQINDEKDWFWWTLKIGESRM